MRNRRAILWMLAAILGLVGLHFAFDLGGVPETAPSDRTVLLPGADRATAIGVARPGAGTLSLEGGLDGWRIVAPFAAPADEQRIRRLADALAFAPIVDSLTDSELLHLGRTREDFALGASAALRLTVSGPDGRATGVRFGSRTPAGDGVYAAVDEVGAVFILGTNDFAAIDLAADAFRRRDLVGDAPGDVAGFDIRLGAGSVSRFARDGEGWAMTAPRQAAASKSAVDAFLESVLAARAETFVWPVGATNETKIASVSLLAGYGLDPEACAAVTLRLRDGSEKCLSFGRESGSGFVYALAPSGATVVTVAAALKDAAANPAAFTDTRLFPYKLSKIASVMLDDGGTVYLLSRSAAGAWHLDAPVSAPADANAVSDLLARLLALRSTDLDAGGIHVGMSTNSAPVAVSRAAALGEARLEDLRSREILKIEAASVRRIVTAVRGTDAPSAVVYNSDQRAWNVDALAGRGGSVDAEAVDGILAALDPLRAAEVVTLRVTQAELAGYGLDDPAFTVAIDRVQEDSVRRNILIGGGAPGGRYATIGSSDAVFVLDAETVRRLTANPVAAVRGEE